MYEDTYVPEAPWVQAYTRFHFQRAHEAYEVENRQCVENTVHSTQTVWLIHTALASSHTYSPRLAHQT